MMAPEPTRWAATAWPVAVALLGAFFMLKLPVLDLPYHWDEGGAYVTPALWLSEVGLHRVLPGWHPPSLFFGHPPGIYLGLASLYAVFGHSIWLTHLVAIGLGGMTLYLTFRIGEAVGGTRAAIFAALLLLLDPLFFAQAGLMHGDMAVAAMGLLAVLFYLQERFTAYVATAVVLVLAKETGLGVVGGVVAYHFFFRSDRPARLQEAAMLASPALALGVFFVATWLTTGRLVDNPYFEDRALFGVSWERFRHATRWLFAEQGRWIPTLSVAAALVALRGSFVRRELALLGLLLLPFWIAFSVLYFLPRYLLPALPALCIAAGIALNGLGQQRRLVPFAALAAAALVFGLEVTGDHDSPGSHEVNLEYVDVVEVHRSAARWIETNRPGARIAAAWPLRAVLKRPALGYVEGPLTVVGPGEEADLLAWSAQGEARNRLLVERARREHWRVRKSFERRGKSVVIFESGAGRGRLR